MWRIWFLLLIPSLCLGQGLVPNEVKYLPVLSSEISRGWPTVLSRSMLASQVRQETCPGLKSKRCWSPMAELKTSREYGFGLGQITVTPAFNNFNEVKKLDPTLRGWSWENRYNAEYQLRSLVLMDKFNHGKFTWAQNPQERMAFSFAAYNGGIGGVLSDRSVCRVTAGCDAGKWFGHVELTSKKSKVAANGYGKSFYEINREYVRHIMVLFPGRYLDYFKENPDA